MTESTPLHACPYCELVFVDHTEVRDHIVHDHPEHADVALSAAPYELPR